MSLRFIVSPVSCPSGGKKLIEGLSEYVGNWAYVSHNDLLTSWLLAGGPRNGRREAGGMDNDWQAPSSMVL